MHESALDGERWSSIRQWVEKFAGIVLEKGRAEFFAARLDALAERERLNEQQIIGRLLAHDREWTLRVAEAASTNYTEFFREREAFEVFGWEILPAFGVAPLRVWSAASSSGEEAYSLAITAYNRLGLEAVARVKVLGTDISERHVTEAERALYAERRLRGLREEERARFVLEGMGQYRVNADVRQMCTFRRLNLTQPVWPFLHRFHVIFLRNVLYYFDAAVRQRLLAACFEAAEPGGWLVTSLTDPTAEIGLPWVPVHPGVFRKASP